MTTTIPNEEIKKLHIEATVMFAVNHIPNIDEDTLEKFLDLVNVSGNFGTISREQLVEKMALIQKYIPTTCEWSLQALSELLEVQYPKKERQSDTVVGVITPFREPEVRQRVWH